MCVVLHIATDSKRINESMKNSAEFSWAQRGHKIKRSIRKIFYSSFEGLSLDIFFPVPDEPKANKIDERND